MAEALWLFDMDGTVIDVNSFPLWVKQILHGRQPQLGLAARIAISAQCAAAIVRRKLLRGSHHGFRRSLQRLWLKVDAAAPTDPRPSPLTTQLLCHVRPNLTLLLNDVSAGRADAILTTAAAAEYALPFARALGFRHAIATPAAGSTDDCDNSGHVKRDRTLRYIAMRGWSGRPIVLFTDHRDDLPLMREASCVVWFGSSEQYRQISASLGAVPVLMGCDTDPVNTYGWVCGRGHGRGTACM